MKALKDPVTRISRKSTRMEMTSFRLTNLLFRTGLSTFIIGIDVCPKLGYKYSHHFVASSPCNLVDISSHLLSALTVIPNPNMIIFIPSACPPPLYYVLPSYTIKCSGISLLSSLALCPKLGYKHPRVLSAQQNTVTSFH